MSQKEINLITSCVTQRRTQLILRALPNCPKVESLLYHWEWVSRIDIYFLETWLNEPAALIQYREAAFYRCLFTLLCLTWTAFPIPLPLSQELTHKHPTLFLLLSLPSPLLPSIGKRLEGLQYSVSPVSVLLLVPHTVVSVWDSGVIFLSCNSSSVHLVCVYSNSTKSQGLLVDSSEQWRHHSLSDAGPKSISSSTIPTRVRWWQNQKCMKGILVSLTIIE